MKDCKKTGRFVVFVEGAKDADASFCCERHIGEHVQAALIDSKRRGRSVRVAYASCDDAPCQSGT